MNDPAILYGYLNDSKTFKKRVAQRVRRRTAEFSKPSFAARFGTKEIVPFPHREEVAKDIEGADIELQTGRPIPQQSGSAIHGYIDDDLDEILQACADRATVLDGTPWSDEPVCYWIMLGTAEQIGKYDTMAQRDIEEMR